MAGWVTEIQRFCVHDGPGIRTTVFLKGCNLRCRWCHNPETLRWEPQLEVYGERCIGCGECVKACPAGAQSIDGGRHIYRREVCRACGTCAKVCFAQGLVLVGREMSVAEVMAEVREDKPFYNNSGGGVTLSGGEPMQQRAFAMEILRECRAEGIRTAIESNFNWPWDQIAEVLPLLDLLMIDIKAVDPELHRQWTGSDNQRILENVRRLSAEDLPVVVRTPVVAGVNDSVDEIGRIAGLLAGFRGLLYYELLPYHPLGESKYRSLGLDPPDAGLRASEASKLEMLMEEARRRGIRVRGPKHA